MAEMFYHQLSIVQSFRYYKEWSPSLGNGFSKKHVLKFENNPFNMMTSRNKYGFNLMAHIKMKLRDWKYFPSVFKVRAERDANPATPPEPENPSAPEEPITPPIIPPTPVTPIPPTPPKPQQPPALSSGEQYLYDYAAKYGRLYGYQSALFAKRLYESRTGWTFPLPIPPAGITPTPTPTPWIPPTPAPITPTPWTPPTPTPPALTPPVTPAPSPPAPTPSVTYRKRIVDGITYWEVDPKAEFMITSYLDEGKIIDFRSPEVQEFVYHWARIDVEEGEAPNTFESIVARFHTGMSTWFKYDDAIGHSTGYSVSASEVRDQGGGVCVDYSVFLAAALRAVGIPTRVTVGWVGATYSGHHAWVEAWWPEMNEWVSIESTYFFTGMTPLAQLIYPAHRTDARQVQWNTYEYYDWTIGAPIDIDKVPIA